ITKIVNYLSAKTEMGSPMICLYLLGNPDHYTNHTFVPFYWQSFQNIVGFSPVDDYILRAPELENVCLYDWVSRCQHVKLKVNNQTHDSVSDNVPDKETDSETDEKHERNIHSRSTLLKFLPEHPFHPFVTTHATRWLAPDKKQIPNFIGATVPRRDQGDREYYCSSMLTLFKPWRTGLDLKKTDNTWNDAFTDFKFSDHQNSIIASMNIWYECLDA
ncbi:hypothetical protein L208DRAFT_1275349, partial [Tricholoma matsutake]